MKCCVPFCKSSREEAELRFPCVHEINFHRLPEDRVMREKWIKAIKGAGPQTYFTWEPYGRWIHVCSLHFKPEDFTFCKTHKHVKPESVPSIFPHHKQSGGQKMSIKMISTLKPSEKKLPLLIQKKETKPKQPKVKDKSKLNKVKKCKISISDNSNKNSNEIENCSTEVSALHKRISNANQSFILNNNDKKAIISKPESQNYSENTVSAKAITVDNSSQNIVSDNQSTNAIENTNLSFIGNVEVSNSDSKVKKFKIFQCTIKTGDNSVDKPTNPVDIYHTYAKHLSKTDGDMLSTKTGKKQSGSLNDPAISVPEIVKTVFSIPENRNLLLQNKTTSVDGTKINEKNKSISNKKIINHSCSVEEIVIDDDENNNDDCITNLNNLGNKKIINHYNQSRSVEEIVIDDNENNDDHCITNLNNLGSRLNVDQSNNSCENYTSDFTANLNNPSGHLTANRNIDNNVDWSTNLNSGDSILNINQSSNNRENNKTDFAANLNNHSGHLTMDGNRNNDSDCATDLNNYSCSLSVNEYSNNNENNEQNDEDSNGSSIIEVSDDSSINEDFSNFPKEPRKDMIYLHAAELIQCRRINNRLRYRIAKLRSNIKNHQSKVHAKNEWFNKFNIEALEKGIESKDAKCLFLKDQLRSLTRDKILWSESSLAFMRQLVKKFPESYDFLKKADAMYLPDPKIVGCKRPKKC